MQKQLRLKLHSWIFLVFLLNTHPSSAETKLYSFQELWEITQNQAPEIRSAQDELKSAEIHERRMSRHWYPHLFLDAKAFTTNDPTMTFISNLGQRRIEGSDFVPAALNFPSSQIFERASIAIDLPLYEGGLKKALSESSYQTTSAKRYELATQKSAKYSDLAKAYASLISLKTTQNELNQIQKQVEDILSQYSIGNKSNPVGYSGLLGLQGLQNRIKSSILEMDAQLYTHREEVRLSAPTLAEDWSPQPQSLVNFLNQHLQLKDLSQETIPSSVRSLQFVASSIERLRAFEKSRFLPKVGLFGSGDLYGGNRRVGTSYTAGAYLQWNLFSGTDYGALEQAELNTSAAQARADGLNQKVQLEISAAKKANQAFLRSLELIDQSSKLLEEQVQVSKKLFQNGAIQALQLVEVLSRRVDQTLARNEVELGLAQSHITQFKHLNLKFNSNGVKDESSK